MRLFWNRKERRPRALWRLICVAVFYLVCTRIFTFLATALWPANGTVPDFYINAPLPGLRLAAGIIDFLAVFASVWLAGRLLDRRPFSGFGFRLSRAWFRDLGFGLFLGVAAVTGVFAAERALGWVAVTGAFETDGDTPFLLAVLVPATAFLCVSVYEELMIRGYFLRNVAEGFNYRIIGTRGAVLIALVVSSSVFGVLHALNPDATFVSTTSLAIGGLMLGLGYVLTGELAVPIGWHAGWNIAQGYVFGFPISGIEPVGATVLSVNDTGPALWTGGAFGPEAGIVGLAAYTASLLSIVLWAKRTRGGLALRLADDLKT